MQSVSNAAQVNEKFPFSGECAPSELIFVDQSAEEANEPASYEWEAVTAGISTAADAPAATVGDQVVVRDVLFSDPFCMNEQSCDLFLPLDCFLLSPSVGNGANSPIVCAAGLFERKSRPCCCSA